MTDSPQPCLTTEELRDYSLGRVPESRFEAIALHIETCASCEDTISSLDGAADSVIDHLRLPANEKQAGATEYVAAIERLAQHPVDSRPEIDATAVGDQRLTTTIRDYQIIELLGAGGMGTVYKAVHLKLDRVVALKLLPTRRIGNMDAEVRFEREMKAIGKLDHPAIVRATDAGDDGGQHFLAMEFVDGFDVAELVDRHGPFSVPDACEIIRQAAIGLQHVHEKGLVHRDIKPSNLMVTAGGQVKILDLGLALLADPLEGVEELTTVGQMMGTVDYMAPEQCDDCHEVDIRADIYSLGATLFKMLTGRVPFATSGRRSPLSRIRALATEPAPRLVECLDGVDPEFGAVVDRLLAREPNDRFATPGEVAEAMASFVDGHDLPTVVAVVKATPAVAAKCSPVVAGAARPSVAAGSHRRFSVDPPAAWKRIARYLLPLAILAVAAIVFRLPTETGELIVECNVPNVQIQLLKDGELHDELSLKQGKTSVSVFSGRYEIKIPGEPDAIEVSADKFTIHRGSKLIAEVRYATLPTPGTPLVGQPKPVKDQPTYGGKTFEEWKQYLVDRDRSRWFDALPAIGNLGVDTNAGEAGRVIFDTVEPWFRFTATMGRRTFPSNATFEDQIRYAAVQAFRPLLNDPEGVALLGEFLKKGGTAARRYAICVLSCSEIKPRDKAPGYVAAVRASSVLVPELIAASYDGDVEVRLNAVNQALDYEDPRPEVINRYVELVVSGNYQELSTASEILFDLAPDKRGLIGERHWQLYVTHRSQFNEALTSGTTRYKIDNIYMSPLELIHIAIEGGVTSDEMTQELLAVLHAPDAKVDDRAQAAWMLGLQPGAGENLTTALLKLLNSRDAALSQKCSTVRYRLEDHPNISQHYRHSSLRVVLFQVLAKIGPSAKEAVPFLNGFVSLNSPGSGNSTLSHQMAEELSDAIRALGRIGPNAASVQAIRKLLRWPSDSKYGGSIAATAAEVLNAIPAEERKRLEAELEEAGGTSR